MIREIRRDEQPQLLELYQYLHEKEAAPPTERARAAWERILSDPNHHVFVAEAGGRLAASCVAVLIPNLTHGGRPYALVENVVTRPDERGKGYATACLRAARDLARSEDCYKIMLMTGSKLESTLRFYERAGFNRADKTAFVQWL